MTDGCFVSPVWFDFAGLVGPELVDLEPVDPVDPETVDPIDIFESGPAEWGIGWAREKLRPPE